MHYHVSYSNGKDSEGSYIPTWSPMIENLPELERFLLKYFTVIGTIYVVSLA